MAGSAAARASISGSVSSMSAATMTSSPWARAASRSRKGKRPLPAMRPSFFAGSEAESAGMGLLQDSALRLLDELDEVGHVFGGQAFALQPFDGLRGI